MTRILSLFVMFMLFGVLAFSQNRVVTGTVIDEKGIAVEGASIKVLGTNAGTATDQNGNFRLSNVAPNATLRVTGTGIPQKDMQVSGNVANFTVTKSDKELSTVVVTALGRRTTSAKLGVSTATVAAKELTQSAPVNLVNGLTGKVSGLAINTTNSGVRGETRITFRGIRSLTGNNQPMLVVDGAQVSLDFLNSINPGDVENVSLLKSSSATTVYGPDGVNGAIIVTTKRGRVGKPVITLSHSLQFEQIAYLPKFQSEYGSGYATDANGNGIFKPIEQQSFGERFDGSIRQFGQTGPNGEKLMGPYSYQPNGRKSFFVTGTTNQTDISYSAGDFFLSAQNAVIKGTVEGDENKRKTVTLRADKQFNKVKVGFSAHYTNTNFNITTANTDIYYGIVSLPGQYNASRFRDYKTDYFASPDGYYTPYLDNRNKTPYFAKGNNRQNGKQDDLFGNAELNYKPTDWLTLTYRLGGTITNLNTENTRGAYQISAFAKTLSEPQSSDITAAFAASTTYRNRLTSELFANAVKRFGKFGVDVLGGYSFRQTNTRFQSIGSDNLGFSPFLSIASRLGEPAVADQRSKVSVDRVFGTLGFDYKEAIYIQGTASYDRDSRLAPPAGDITSKQIGVFYPGINTSILLHKLIPAITNNNFLNTFKIRGAISKTGNVNAVAYQNDVIFNPSNFFPFGSTPGFTQSTAFFPSTIKPEFVLNKEVGIELGFLKGRVSVEGNYYRQTNTDQILDLQLSNSSGFTSSRLNAASFINKGYEIDLKLTPLVKFGNVDVNIKANYSKQESEIKSLVDGVNELGIGNANFAIVGQPAFKFKLTDYKRDGEGHVIVGKNGMPSINSNLTTFGQTAPTDIVGITLGVNWKSFSFAAVGEYRGGNQILVDQLGGFLDDNGISARSAQNGRRAFIFPNSVIETAPGSGKYVTNTDVYTSDFGINFYNSNTNTGAQTNYLASGAFWKLREVSLSYSLPSTVFNGKSIKGITFGITGRNLLTWLPKSNQWTDPEFSANGNAAFTGNAVGRSTAYNLPPTRNFGANVSIQF